MDWGWHLWITIVIDWAFLTAAYFYGKHEGRKEVRAAIRRKLDELEEKIPR